MRLDRKAFYHLQAMHRCRERHGRIAELAQQCIFEIGIAVPLAQAPALARHFFLTTVTATGGEEISAPVVLVTTAVKVCGPAVALSASH